ncbi:hypothetical protein [Streptomyces sp. NPDC054834]
MTLSPIADATLLARLTREAAPTDEYFRTRTRTPAGSAPLPPRQQRTNYETLATASQRPQTAPDQGL